MSSLDLSSSSALSNTAWASAVPSSIRTTADVANAALTAKTGQAAMGQSDFLKLFTTQLTNQDPTDPVKNEAFVAQLAQFSQLEATTNMATSLSDFTTSMSSSQMTNSAGLIGTQVAVPDGPAILTSGTPVPATIALPNGADGVTLQVYDSKGVLVSTQTAGAQTAGDMQFSWNGQDDTGNALPSGTYRFAASAVSQSKNITPSVSTLVNVTGVSQKPDKSIWLSVAGGKTVALSSVTQIF
ncbi:MAG: FlgD immunoglobulin-like domain containing protein [Betaproteobacteria bacterium]